MEILRLVMARVEKIVLLIRESRNSSFYVSVFSRGEFNKETVYKKKTQDLH